MYGVLGFGVSGGEVGMRYAGEMIDLMSKIHKLLAELETSGELTPMERCTIITAMAELHDRIEAGNCDSRWDHDTRQDMVRAIGDLMRIENYMLTI